MSKIPRITPEVAKTWCYQHDGRSFLKEMLTRLKKENPAPIDFLVSICGETGVDSQSVIFGALAMYRMIEIQMDCDELE